MKTTINDKKAKILSEGLLAYASTLKDKDANPEELAKAMERAKNLTPEELSKQLQGAFDHSHEMLDKGVEILLSLLADLVHLTGVNPIEEPDSEINKKAEEICKVLSVMQKFKDVMFETFMSTFMFAFTDTTEFEKYVKNLKDDIFKNVKNDKGVN